jgi:large subunit ribosomal protein L22
MARYSRTIDEKTEARAMARDLNISHKHAIAIARTLSPTRKRRKDQMGKVKTILKVSSLKDGMDFLNDVVEKKKPVRMGATKAGHRKGTGFGPGRYPQKAASRFLELLYDIESNAEEHLGVSSAEELDIVHVSAQKGVPIKSNFARARGRATPKNRDTIHIELIVRKRDLE